MGAKESLQDVMKRRGLSQKDILAAAKTYVPTGKRDEYIAFSSGGQSGQVIVYGIPSMRILKYIAVFTPEPWQGYGFDEESKAVLQQGYIDGREIIPITRPSPKPTESMTGNTLPQPENQA
jgi:nitrous-oxide reductase